MDIWFSEKKASIWLFWFLVSLESTGWRSCQKILGRFTAIKSPPLYRSRSKGGVEQELKKLHRKRSPAINKELIHKDLPKLVISSLLQSGGNAEVKPGCGLIRSNLKPRTRARRLAWSGVDSLEYPRSWATWIQVRAQAAHWHWWGATRSGQPPQTLPEHSLPGAHAGIPAVQGAATRRARPPNHWTAWSKGSWREASPLRALP